MFTLSFLFLLCIPLQVFLWGKPTKATWDSLFIDGTVTRKNKEGDEVEYSKNWLQEKIASATNYDGSLLDQLLGGMKLEIGGAVGADDVQDELGEEKVEVKAEPKKLDGEFEFADDKGDEPPFDPDPKVSAKPVEETKETVAQTTASPSDVDDEEAALLKQMEALKAKKALAAQQAAAELQKAKEAATAKEATEVAPKDKKADVDAALAAMGLV